MTANTIDTIPPTEQSSVPVLAVVIIGLNEGERIAACIESVRAAVAGLNDVDIVYVDSGSVDDTISIALSKGVRVFQLGSRQAPSPAAGRYVGSRETRGRFIMFVDGDSILARGWVGAVIKVMEDDSEVAMVSGRIVADPAWAGLLEDVTHLGAFEPVSRIGGGRAPIIRRDVLEKAGNWNPFVRCREEEDLACRIRHHAPGRSKILMFDRTTVYSPVQRPSPREFVRRWRRGFVRGPGQVLRNALVGGYWRACLPMACQSILTVAFILGVVLAAVAGLWWQFIVAVLAAVALRAIVTGHPERMLTFVYSLAAGGFGVWEFLTVPARDSQDYVCDYIELTQRNGR